MGLVGGVNDVNCPPVVIQTAEPVVSEVIYKEPDID